MTHAKQRLFIRALSSEDEAVTLAAAIRTVRIGGARDGATYITDPSSFRQIPTSPFAYWVSERVRRLFTELRPFESEGRSVRQGLATADDFRFVRAWWEVPARKIVSGTRDCALDEFRRQTFDGKRWAPFAKGGSFSPFYADLHLVANWERAGEEIKKRISPATKRPYSNVWQLGGTEEHYFFRPGLTWPRRTAGLSLRPLPAGSVFGDKGPATFVADDSPATLLVLCSLANSAVFSPLVRTLVARVALAQSFEVGLIKAIPVPSLNSQAVSELGRLGASVMRARIEAHRSRECAHDFTDPFLKPPSQSSLAETASQLREGVARLEMSSRLALEALDSNVIRLYKLDGEIGALRNVPHSLPSLPGNDDESPADPDDDDDSTIALGGEVLGQTGNEFVADAVSYALGCTFGRWDIHLATGSRLPPPLPDPFAALPVCSPGMLVGDDALPASSAPPSYPLAIAWDGILVDDPTHPDDVVRRVRDVLTLLWGDGADSIEKEACEILEVRELREYFRNPKLFFEEHIRRYSKSHRRAPIYWLLQSKQCSYGLWLYYHRLDRDTVHKAIRHNVAPKINAETARMKELKAQLGAGKETMPRGERTKLEKQIERQDELLGELEAFRTALDKVTALGYDPDLDDGVVLNIAPVHELTPWKEAKAYWDDLTKGKYEWSTISKRLRDKGVIPR